MTAYQLRENKVSYWLVPSLIQYKVRAIIVSHNLISTLVCTELQITHDELIGRDRHLNIAKARHLIFYLLHKYTRLHLKQIGDIIGGRHHSTVIYGIQNAKDQIDTDPDFKKLTERIESKIV